MDSADLSSILARSGFVVEEGRYAYCTVRARPAGRHFLVAEDADEITVATTVERLGELDLIERNRTDYALIAIHVSVPFESAGFLAAVTRAIAGRGMNLLAVSTYSKDYVLVPFERRAEAIVALEGLGLRALGSAAS